MDQGLIPRRYAKALLDVAGASGVSTGLYGCMTALHRAFEAAPELNKAVANPFVPLDDKARLLEVAAQIKPGEKDAAVFRDFVKLLVRNRRIGLMREMTTAFIDLYRRTNDIVRVDVTSASPLSGEARKRLLAIIGRKLPANGSVELVEKVDPALIGGFVININNERLDASVRTELEQLRLKLLK